MDCSLVRRERNWRKGCNIVDGVEDQAELHLPDQSIPSQMGSPMKRMSESASSFVLHVLDPRGIEKRRWARQA